MTQTPEAKFQLVDLGLLYLRLVAGISLLLKHGLEKPEHFALMAQHFPDPIHIGPVPSLVFAMVSDFACSLLVIAGFGTRVASAIVSANIFVAWAFVHHFAFFGQSSDHGELIVLYLSAFGSLLIAGSGRYSIDRILRDGKRV